MTASASPDTATDRPARARRTAWDVQREVLFALVIRESSARVGGQWVGAVWTLIEPLAHTMLMVTVLGTIAGRASASYEYPVFLLTGLIPFFLFQNLANRLMDGIEANRGLYGYRQVKPMDVLIARSVVEAGMNLLVYAFALGIFAWLGFHVVPADLLGVILVNLLLIALGFGFGTFVAVVTHERPRLRSMVRMSMMPLYFASGVVFQVDLLPREYIDLLLWNPLIHLIELQRHAFIPAYVPTEGVQVLYPTLYTLGLTALALSVYWRARHRLIRS